MPPAPRLSPLTTAPPPPDVARCPAGPRMANSSSRSDTPKRPWWRSKRLWGLLAALGFLIYSFWGTDPRAIWHIFLKIKPIYLLPVMAGVIGMPLARAIRLKYILDPQRKVTGIRLFAIYSVGQFLNIVLPALTGQVGRVILFSRTLDVTKTMAFTMVVLELLFDGLTMLMLIFGASFLVVLPPALLRGEIAILIACIFLFGFFYLALHRHKTRKHRFGWWRNHVPARLVREWDNVKASFLAGLDMLTSTRHLVVVSFFSIVSWLAHALIVLFLLHTFGFQLPLWAALVILIVNTLAIMIPLTPGNIGTFQFACIIGLGFFGIPKDEALGFSIFLHLFEVGPVILLGLIASFSQHVRVSEYRTPEALAEQERLAREVLTLEPISGETSEKLQDRQQ